MVVVNEVDRELPPGLDLAADKEWLHDDKPEAGWVAASLRSLGAGDAGRGTQGG